MRGAERVTRAARGKTAMFGAGSFATLNFLPQIFAHGVGCKEFVKEFTVFPQNGRSKSDGRRAGDDVRAYGSGYGDVLLR